MGKRVADMTPEERERKRAKDRAYQRAYRQANAEKIAAQRRAHRQANALSHATERNAYVVWSINETADGMSFLPDTASGLRRARWEAERLARVQYPPRKPEPYTNTPRERHDPGSHASRNRQHQHHQ